MAGMEPRQLLALGAAIGSKDFLAKLIAGVDPLAFEGVAHAAFVALTESDKAGFLKALSRLGLSVPPGERITDAMLASLKADGKATRLACLLIKSKGIAEMDGADAAIAFLDGELAKLIGCEEVAGTVPAKTG